VKKVQISYEAAAFTHYLGKRLHIGTIFFLSWPIIKMQTKMVQIPIAAHPNTNLGSTRKEKKYTIDLFTLWESILLNSGYFSASS
jgi:hypothetical protein